MVTAPAAEHSHYPIAITLFAIRSEHEAELPQGLVRYQDGTPTYRYPSQC